jgi:hypothetical protein
MEQSVSREAESCQAGQGILYLLWNYFFRFIIMFTRIRHGNVQSTGRTHHCCSFKHVLVFATN